MQDKINILKKSAIDCIDSIENLKDLTQAKIKLFGKKSELSLLLNYLREIDDPEEKKYIGEMLNNLSRELKEKIINLEHDLRELEQDKIFKSERIDISVSIKKRKIGNLHVLSKVLNEIENIFISMGYSVMHAREIETTYYNFDALNISQDHPARNMQDTFYLDHDQVLVTATSPMQIRLMETNRPPIKIISPGRVYRPDSVDATHLPVFNQIEGLVIDKNIKFSDLKGTLDIFAHELIDKNIKTRFRPHYFPFTEPSAEMDVSCFICNGSGCATCKHTGFIELLGCGIVHPKVLSNSKINPDKFSGFAFGMGLERIAMLKYGISDIRLFYENDFRFLSQF